MRWKLLLVTAFLAALGSATGSFAACKLGNYFQSTSPLFFFIISTVFLSAAITYASIFVYRHNARRRKLQAILTVVFALILAVAFFALLIQLRLLPQLFS